MSFALMLIAQLGFSAVGAWITHVDIRDHRIPNRVVVPLAGAVFALCAGAALVDGSADPLVRAALGGLGLGLFYAVLRAASGGALGGGDVKLAVPVGALLAWDGWIAFFAGSGLAFLIGGAWSMALLATRRGSAKTPIAFGPFMVLGATVGLAIT